MPVTRFLGLPLLLLAAGTAAAALLAPDASAEARTAAVREATPSRPVMQYDAAAADWSGLARTGEASFYADEFAGRTMADGTAMDPQGDNAASLTLPLGTTARVTNLKTGQQAIVTIQDRGPYAKGRIVDLSPSTAQKVGITKEMGVARVEVAPIAMPRNGDSRKAAPGAAGAAKDPRAVPAPSR
jgi:rare lipoprotein A